MDQRDRDMDQYRQQESVGNGNANDQEIVEPTRESRQPMASQQVPVQQMQMPVESKFNNALESVSNAAQSIKEKAGGTSVSMIVLGCILAILICVLVGYGMYWLITTSFTKNTGIIIPETRMPIRGTSVIVGSGDMVPRPRNGKRLTFSFWIYINDLDYFHGSYRHVMHRGNDMNGSGPLVVLNNEKNKLHIRFANTKDTNNVATNGSKVSPQQPFLKDTSELKNEYKYTVNDENYMKVDMLTHGITIDYIPLQRWVHVAVVVNEEIKRGAMYTYLDGELVNTVTSDDSLEIEVQKDNKPIKRMMNYDFSRLNLDVQGDFTFGGNPSDPTVGPGFDGLLSKVQFFNYDLNGHDIYDVYLQGPINSVLAKMGLPAYGVQAPIYRIA